MDFAVMGWILAVFYGVFLFRRLCWRRRNRGRKKAAGFYPTYSSMGVAFQVLHKEFVQPEMAYVFEEQMEDEADEDDEGEEVDPEKYLMRQLRRVRNGEEVDLIKVMVRARDIPEVEPVDCED
jgi:hypothetical protein